MIWGGGGGGGQVCAPYIQASVKFRDFEKPYRQLVFNKSLSNLAVLLILRRSFQWWRRIFPNLSMSKVEKNREKVCYKKVTWMLEGLKEL